jgi:hypothetical protein
MAGTSTSAYANSNGYGLGAQAVAYAARYLGVPYVWGGADPHGFDCSGLVQWVYDHLGVSLPRTSQEQASTGVSVAPNELQPGDLIFYNEPGEGPNSHVAIYAGAGQEIEAPRPGESVKWAPVDWAHFAGARRVSGAVTGFPSVTQAGDVQQTSNGLLQGVTTDTRNLVVTAVFVLGGVALLVLGVQRLAGGAG